MPLDPTPTDPAAFARAQADLERSIRYLLRTFAVEHGVNVRLVNAIAVHVPGELDVDAKVDAETILVPLGLRARPVIHLPFAPCTAS
jgi:hypothetical protein